MPHDNFTNDKANILSVQLPETPEELSQDEEWCVVHYNGLKKRIRFHNYDEIYEIPGLYEYLFYDILRCNSPQVVCSLLEKELKHSSLKISDLNVLDIGAGNGMVGEQLKKAGVKSVTGIDVIDEAADATERDRPDIYNDYHVVNLTDIPQSTYHELKSETFNCLTTVAALGFGDIPPLAFANAYNLISTPGWIAFNIKKLFLSKKDTSGFFRLIHRIVDSGILNIRCCRRYRHRLSLDGSPLYYCAIVGVKKANIPMNWFK